MSAVAHYVAGVLDYDSMAQIMDALCAAATFQPGDRVKTFRGSLRGTIIQILPDGRVAWRSDFGVELTALPESLLKEK